MPIDKLDEVVRKSDTAPECRLLDHSTGKNKICCCECGDDEKQLRRVKEDGKKVKPAKYICIDCHKEAGKKQMIKDIGERHQ